MAYDQNANYQAPQRPHMNQAPQGRSYQQGRPAYNGQPNQYEQQQQRQQQYDDGYGYDAGYGYNQQQNNQGFDNRRPPPQSRPPRQNGSYPAPNQQHPGPGRGAPRQGPPPPQQRPPPNAMIRPPPGGAPMGYGRGGQQGQRPGPGHAEPQRAMPQDSAFPVFPSAKRTPAQQSIEDIDISQLDDNMRGMRMGDQHHQGAGGGRPRGPSQGGYHGQAGFNDYAPGPPNVRMHGYPQHPQNLPLQNLPPRSQSARPQQEQHRQPISREPPIHVPHRSMTMPNSHSQPPGPTRWAEPGPSAGYHGPESPSYIPTPQAMAPLTSGSQPVDSNWPLNGDSGAQGGPKSNHEPRHEAAQQTAGSHSRQVSLGDFYDTYYEPNDPAGPDIGLPDFDAQPNRNAARHNSLDQHLGVASGPGAAAHVPPPAPSQRQEYDESFAEQAPKARPQPEFRSAGQQPISFVHEMPGDIPAAPPVQHQYNGYQNQNHGQGGYVQQRPSPGPGNGNGYGPPPQQAYGQPMMGGGRGGPPPRGYPPGAPSPQLHPPVNRTFSEQSQRSDPGPPIPPGPGGPPPLGGLPARPSTAQSAGPGQRRPGPGPGGPGSANPDALPYHPVPVRPGLLEQSSSQSSGQRPPPPVRQYGSDPAAGVIKGAPNPSARTSVRKSTVVTHDELQRLRGIVSANPNDNRTQLILAKKLVEAATVLADEGGHADTKTRNKNREKYILDGHKIVKKLVSNGYPDAMFYLADCYGQGLLGLESDPKEAFSLYQSAAKAGHASAAYRTAVCCEIGAEDGGGTRKDPLKAVQWYKRAAALGDTPAMYKMGIILLKGLLAQPKNMGEAVNWLKRAADQADEENPHALHELALLYEAPPGNTDRIIRDEAYSFQLFNQAADIGYKFSQYRLGQAHEYGMMGCAIDARGSILWYTRAAAQGEHQSELALSGWYLTGSPGILEQSDTEAYLWARKAACAEPPLPKAMFAMGYYTEVGIGCPRSLDEAKRWYGRAAAYKFPKAQERLEELKHGGARAQKNRERLSRTNQRQHEENCTLM